MVLFQFFKTIIREWRKEKDWTKTEGIVNSGGALGQGYAFCFIIIIILKKIKKNTPPKKNQDQRKTQKALCTVSVAK